MFALIKYKGNKAINNPTDYPIITLQKSQNL